jgi:hypothetical protein
MEKILTKTELKNQLIKEISESNMSLGTKLFCYDSVNDYFKKLIKEEEEEIKLAMDRELEDSMCIKLEEEIK